MDWDALGAIGELAGAIGVIVSLVYLGSQIKSQNSESKAAAVESMTAQWNAFMSDMATNTELARIWEAGLRSIDELEPTEFVQLSTHFNRIFRIYESMFRQHQAGRLDDELWEGLNSSMADFSKSPGVSAWWKLRGHWFSRGFRTYVQQHVDATSGQVLKYDRAPLNQATNSDA